MFRTNVLRTCSDRKWFLAIWLPGVENTRADALSRGQRRGAAVAAEAVAAGWIPSALPLPPSAFDVLRAVARLSQQ